MARKKVTLSYITNDTTRRSTFKKRRKGLIKKLMELSTLCDVGACAVVYSPYDPHPEVWPTSAPEAARVISRFQSLPETERCRKMTDQEGFLRQQLSKMQEQLRKQERERREIETAMVMYDALAGRCRLQDLGIGDATSLAWAVDMRLKSVQQRIHELLSMVKQREAAEKPELAAPAVRVKNPIELAMEELERQNWFGEENPNPNEGAVLFSGLEELLNNHADQPFVDQGNPWLDDFFTSFN